MTPKQQKWVAKLLGYDYEIQYRPGRETSAADALSRKQDSPILHQLFYPKVSLWDQIRKAATSDPYVSSKQTEATSTGNNFYSSWDGLLLYKGRVIIP